MRLLFRLGPGSLLGKSARMELEVHETSIQAWTRISARKVGKHGAGGA